MSKYFPFFLIVFFSIWVDLTLSIIVYLEQQLLIDTECMPYILEKWKLLLLKELKFLINFLHLTFTGNILHS